MGRGDSIVGEAGQVWKRQQGHCPLKVGEEFWVLCSPRGQLICCKLQSFVDLLRADQLDQPEKMKMEEERGVCVENL